MVWDAECCHFFVGSMSETENLFYECIQADRDLWTRMRKAVYRFLTEEYLVEKLFHKGKGNVNGWSGFIYHDL